MRLHTVSFSLVAALALGGCGKATQTKPQCRAQQAEYAAQYFKTAMEGDCTDKVLTGEVLNLAYYRSDPSGGIPKLAIESASVADAINSGEEAIKDHPEVKVELMPHEYALGSFKAVYPDAKDLCEAPTLTEAGVNVSEIPGDPAAMPPVDPTPAVSIKYKWSNFKVITKPLSNAIHFGADLVRTDGDCKVTYKVSAINPALHCGDGKKMVDTAEIDPMTMMPKIDPATGKTLQVEVDDPESGNPNQAACKASKVGESSGSGLAPDYDYECKEHILLCVPKNEFPSFPKK
jgi:hypothetical protein